MKAFYFLALSAVFNVACSSSNLLSYGTRPYYHISNVIDKSGNLRQQICYNRPRMIDEEHCYNLFIELKDTALIPKRILDVEKDADLIFLKYDLFSVWNWEDESYEIKGTIEILQRKADRITLKENITIKDFSHKETKRFKGIRTFYAAKSSE